MPFRSLACVGGLGCTLALLWEWGIGGRCVMCVGLELALRAAVGVGSRAVGVVAKGVVDAVGCVLGGGAEVGGIFLARV